MARALPVASDGFWAALASFSPLVKKNLAVLFAAQALSTGATTVSTTLSSIVIVDITGSEALSGVPSTLNFFVSAISAYWAGRLMAARGRRFGLGLGYAIGAVGAVLGATMALQHNLIGFLIGGMLLGVANGAIQQGKYAAGEMVGAGVRGSVVGALLTGSAFGSVLSWLASPLVNSLASANRVPAIEAGWYLGGFWLALGALLIWGFLGAAAPSRDSQAQGSAVQTSPALLEPLRSWSELLAVPAIRLALVSMGLGQMVMVGLMVLMPLHAKHLGHVEAATGLISVHILGMFAFGWLTGRLADLWGRRLVIQLGAAGLMIAGFVATFATRPLEMGFSLFVLGLGWNFLNVAGSTLLTDALRPSERARVQGGAELLTWLSAAIGALGGGFIVAGLGFATVGWVGLALGALPFVATLVLGSRASRAVALESSD